MTVAYVGTSGFSYPTWKPDFYPAGTPQKDFLRAYAEWLPSAAACSERSRPCTSNQPT